MFEVGTKMLIRSNFKNLLRCLMLIFGIVNILIIQSLCFGVENTESTTLKMNIPHNQKAFLHGMAGSKTQYFLRDGTVINEIDELRPYI